MQALRYSGMLQKAADGLRIRAQSIRRLYTSCSRAALPAHCCVGGHSSLVHGNQLSCTCDSAELAMLL